MGSFAAWLEAVPFQISLAPAVFKPANVRVELSPFTALKRCATQHISRLQE